MAGPSHSDQHVEVEFKLAVVGPDPSAVLAIVAATDEVAGFDLGVGQRQSIRDTYWDTRDGTLARRHVALRTRRLGSADRFTLKSGGRSSGGLFTRRELEVSADAEGWRTIRTELAGRGVVLPERPPVHSAPDAWPLAAGLNVTQKRTTKRIARQVFRDGVAVAELALDTTTYHLRGQQVVHREIEIEELEPTPETEQGVARAIGEALLAGMPGSFEPATMSKYGRGLRLSRQLGSADPEP